MIRLTFIAILLSTSLLADTLNVVPGGKLESIKVALNIARAGDVIQIAPGLYQEGQIIVDKAVTLIGIQYPIIDGSNESEIITIKANGVTIKGLQIQNVGTSYLEDRAGIKLDGVSDCVIQDNRLYDCFFGIYLKQSNDTQIINNEIIGEARFEMSSGNAIHLWYCKNISIVGNTVSHHRDGIYLEFVDESIISGNTSTNNLRYGLHFMFSDQDEYTHNVFKANGAGAAVMFSRDIIMRNNLFENNWGTASYALLLKEIYDGEITSNTFKTNTVGIYAESVNRLLIKNNDFKANGWALKIMGSCMDNKFTANNFYTNTFDLTTSGKSDHNTYIGNYWSGYTGYDLDKNGYGDVPYRPVKMFSYLVANVDVSIILLRSLFIDILNFAEKVTPIFIPEGLVDPNPLMKPRL